MSEYCREQHPLLDEAFEEDHSPQYFRRRSMTSKRSRNNLKGAASIIKQWPDHWSSFLRYWWIGVFMIGITTFAFYNSVAFTIMPAAAFKPSNYILTEVIKKTTPSANTLTDAFMHVFVHQNKEIDLKDYVPYIETFSKNYSNFKYHLLLIINDTNVNWLSAEENNEIALNTLWVKEDQTSKDASKINVQYITLSAYMDNSPLVKYWRFLPPSLVEFLARMVSVWDRGGIVFNPNILTDKFQRSLYLEKIHNLFHKYSRQPLNKKYKEVNGLPESAHREEKSEKKRSERKFNNIQDIINALEKDNESINPFSEQSLVLVEAENIILPSAIKQERNDPLTSESSKNEPQENNQTMFQISLIPGSVNYTKEYDLSQNITNTTKLGLLPQFLDYLFRNKANTTEETKVRKRKNVVDLPKNERSKTYSLINTTDKLEKIEKEYKPVIVPAPETFRQMEKDGPLIQSSESESTLQPNQLTIDLKGNIIATNTPCHAFLGTIFSNAVHYSDVENVTDLIISELTIFCKGVLSTCKGIELILL